MNKLIFTKYAELQKQIQQLEEEKKEVAKLCIVDMKENKIERFNDDLGVYSLMKRNFYKYSDKIKELEDNVKIVKTVEENEGIAEKTTVESLRFQSIKVGNNNN